MLPNVKKVVAINDLSGFGRASLTSIIPTLSSMGIQVCPVPTAILSTHSGGFEDYTFLDMTDNMLDYVNHWKKLGLTFDCIYTGFLGSPKQVDIVCTIIDEFRSENTLVVADTVMGDDGELYCSVSKDMVPEMRKLIKKVDIIVPNFTEAGLLLGRDPQSIKSDCDIKAWLRDLSDIGPNTVVITSVPDFNNPKNINTVSFDKKSNEYWKVSVKKLPTSYPGTGDIFGSVMIGSILQGDSLPISMDRAVQFITQCIQSSRSYDYPVRDGVLLERELHMLRESSKICGYEEM